jgi:hypothetical protein
MARKGSKLLPGPLGERASTLPRVRVTGLVGAGHEDLREQLLEQGTYQELSARDESRFASMVALQEL